MFEELQWLSAIELILFLSDYVTIILGLVISYIAYRGYRDHHHRPMLFVATGFILLMGGPGLFSIIYFVSPVNQTVIAILTQVSEVAGMCSILYGLWVNPE